MNKKKAAGFMAVLAAFLAALFGRGNPANAAPSAPARLTVAVAATAAGPDSVVVAWDAPPNTGSAVDAYRVTMFVNGQLAMTPASVGGGVARFAWAITGIAPGQTVTVLARVEAHNRKGWGPPGEASAPYTATDMIPGAPTVRLEIKPGG